MNGPAGTPAASVPLSHPESVGPYRVLGVLAHGGMGMVYTAEQTEPVRRRVALKVIKAGMDTREVVARFEAERQALAVMDHPSIAKVLDGGATADGRPYFVMELVQGVSITEYCDKNNLSTKDRLALFLQVCQAVQHAHQKGIIHRDIKPSNVMVTHHDGKPVPKVIDFGIAKATNQKLTEKTLFTRYAHIIGTPAYMSPEQAELSDLDIDTRSDIYSLGVLLYELLTGRPPFDPKSFRAANNLGTVYFKQKRLAEARQAFGLSLQANPAYPPALNNLGATAEAEGKLGEALEWYLRSAAAQESYALAHKNAAGALQRAGRLAEAESYARTALRYHPEYMEAWHILGITLFQQGRRQEGLDCLLKARSIGEDLDLNRNLAIVYKTLGEPEKAEAARRRYEAMGGK